MKQALEQFISYLHNIKNTSTNTELSYTRDLKKMIAFCEDKELTDLVGVTEGDLLLYLESMKEKNFKAATISRNIFPSSSALHQTGLLRNTRLLDSFENIKGDHQ